MKKYLSMLIALMMVAGLMANPAISCAEEDTSDIVKYSEGITGGSISFDKSTGTITDCDESVTGSITIPSEIESVKVSKIGEEAFYNCLSIEHIVVPDSVVHIEGFAFSFCENLISIKLPEEVEYFAGGDVGVFSGCSSLLSVSIPNGATAIENEFNSCQSLTSITFPKSVTSIDINYLGLPELENITVHEDNPYFSSREGVLFNEDQTELIQYPRAKEDIDNYTIPNSVEIIGYAAFTQNEALKKITIPSSVNTIKEYAFTTCKVLEEINVDSNNVTYCSDDGVLFDKGQTCLWAYPKGNVRTKYIVPTSVNYIKNQAFANNENLREIVLHENVTSIDKPAFIGCNNLTIYGYSGSYAETYAKANNIPFADIENPGATPTPGGGSGDSTLGQDDSDAENPEESTPDQESPAPAPDPEKPDADTPVQDEDADEKTGQPVDSRNETVKLEGGVIVKVDTKKDGTATITKVNNTNKKTITINDTVTIDGVKYKVTAIESNVFKNCKKATKIVISANVKVIKKNAFAGLKKLKAIHYKGKKSIKINKGAFKGLKTKDMKFTVNKKMNKNELNKFKKSLKKAGFKGTVKRGR